MSAMSVAVSGTDKSTSPISAAKPGVTGQTVMGMAVASALLSFVLPIGSQRPDAGNRRRGFVMKQIPRVWPRWRAFSKSENRSAGTRLVQFDVGVAYHLAPFLVFADDEFRELRRRHRHR